MAGVDLALVLVTDRQDGRQRALFGLGAARDRAGDAESERDLAPGRHEGTHGDVLSVYSAALSSGAGPARN